MKPALTPLPRGRSNPEKLPNPCQTAMTWLNRIKWKWMCPSNGCILVSVCAFQALAYWVQVNSINPTELRVRSSKAFSPGVINHPAKGTLPTFRAWVMKMELRTPQAKWVKGWRRLWWQVGNWARGGAAGGALPGELQETHVKEWSFLCLRSEELSLD